MTSANETTGPRARPLQRVEPGKARHFLGDLGFAVHYAADDTVSGTVTVSPVLCTPETGQVRSGVLATLADVVAGRLAALRTAPVLAVTVDLAYHAFGAVPATSILAVARVVKAGRTTIVTETRYYGSSHSHDIEPSAAPFAVCLGTFVASGRPSDLLPSTAAGAIPIVGTGSSTLDVDVLSRLDGVTHADGEIEVALHSEITNSAGLLQGGAVAVLADGAAASAATGRNGSPCTVRDLDVRFLGPLRVGPVRTSVELLAESAHGGTAWRVSLRDMGSGGRLGTVAIARCAPADDQELNDQ
jgi:uncharacterized protein (TIGR00369 family)